MQWTTDVHQMNVHMNQHLQQIEQTEFDCKTRLIIFVQRNNKIKNCNKLHKTFFSKLSFLNEAVFIMISTVPSWYFFYFFCFSFYFFKYFFKHEIKIMLIIEVGNWNHCMYLILNLL